MKKFIMAAAMGMVLMTPALSHARGAPLFFQTGDELFEVSGAPALEEGFKPGYACQRFGLFGADVWTWDCKMMAVNLAEFSVADLDPAESVKLASQYPLSSRERSLWNHYGILLLIAALGIAGFLKLRSS